MNNLRDLFTRPTNATLTEGNHKVKLISVEFPEIQENKKEYVILTFLLENGCTLRKNAFEKELEILANRGKRYYNIADTNASLQDITEKMMLDFIPVTIKKENAVNLKMEQVTYYNWHYFATTEEEKTTARDEVL